MSWGDLNQDSADSPFANFVSEYQAAVITDHKPTRWDGPYCTDWFFTSIPHSIHWEGHGIQAVSDHIPIRCSLLTNKEEELQVARCHGRLKPGPKWLKPPAITSEAWIMQLETAWEDSLASSEGFAFTQQLASAELF